MDESLNATALLLVQQQLLSKEAAQHYQQAAQTQSCRFLAYLVQHAHLCPNLVAKTLAEHFELTLIDLDCFDKNTLPNHIMTPALLRKHHVLPIKYDANQLYIAVDDPNQQATFKEIQFITGLHIIPMIAQTLQLSQMIETCLRITDHQGLSHYLNTQPTNTHPTESFSAQSHYLPPSNDDEAPIVTFVQRLLHQAIARGATDVHFEPYDDIYRVRYRQNGLLSELATPPQPAANRIATRLKIMADLDISERRLPQDGRFTILSIAQQPIDCRISTCPTINGEKIAIRLLTNGATKPNITQLGLHTRDKDCFIAALLKPQGLILVTGPTGCGKTITLYSALHYLNHIEKNISTAEDPVEIKLSGINQVQINPKIGLTFATTLRAFLRQDPDIIMIGEIRDEDTADIAIKASQTGHLVLSTLHTNSSADTIIRLTQIGIPPFLLASTLSLIMAQRLVRQLCVYCKIPQNQTNKTGYMAQGCHRCQQGYQGRIGLFEVMPISPALQQLMVLPQVTAKQLTMQAQQEGMLTLTQMGSLLVQQGITSLEEINRIL
jgi:type IV pilus assembly protein PilB